MIDRDVEAVAKAARAKLADAGVVLVEADMAGLFEQNGKVSFVVALHEPIADIPAYLKASGIDGITLAAFAVVLASGAVIALAGPSWWHGSSLGHLVNSMHLWSVELFFFFMVVHLWAKFFMAAWRGRRAGDICRSTNGPSRAAGGRR